MIKIGCSGFPVGRTKYEQKLAVVEASQFFDKFPLSRTIDKWKEARATHFEYVVCAPKTITHLTNTGTRMRSKGPTRHHLHGYFQDSAEVNHAYSKAYTAAQTLSAKIIFFKLPPTIAPQPENIGRIQKFFSSIRRDNMTFVWEPPVNWPGSIVEALSKSLRMTPAVNPLRTPPTFSSPLRYFRLGDPERTRGVHSFSDGELQRVRKACDRMSYVIFNNGPTAFEDALRFKELR